MAERLVGRYVNESHDFDARVDAVSSATLTSLTIFEGLQEADAIYKELKKKGYLN